MFSLFVLKEVFSIFIILLSSGSIIISFMILTSITYLSAFWSFVTDTVISILCISIFLVIRWMSVIIFVAGITAGLTVICHSVKIIVLIVG